MKDFILKNKYPFLITPDTLEEVVPNDSIKSVLLYAAQKESKPFSGGRWDWILLVDKFTHRNDDFGFEVSVHSNFAFSCGMFFIKPNINEEFAWGYSNTYRFYLLSDIQKKYYIEQLNKCGFKFVKSLNKLIER